jgi:hypothetical protein
MLIYFIMPTNKKQLWMICIVCLVILIVIFIGNRLTIEEFGGGGGGRGGGGRGGRVGGGGWRGGGSHIGRGWRGGGWGRRGYYGGYYGGGGGGGGGYYGWIPFFYWLYPQEPSNQTVVLVPTDSTNYYPSQFYSYPYNSNQII